VNYASPQEHVPEAERNNRVIKERIPLPTIWSSTSHHGQGSRQWFCQ
jgi:hypothetical protein